MKIYFMIVLTALVTFTICSHLLHVKDKGVSPPRKPNIPNIPFTFIKIPKTNSTVHIQRIIRQGSYDGIVWFTIDSLEIPQP